MTVPHWQYVARRSGVTRAACMDPVSYVRTSHRHTVQSAFQGWLRVCRLKGRRAARAVPLAPGVEGELGQGSRPGRSLQVATAAGPIWVNSRTVPVEWSSNLQHQIQAPMLHVDRWIRNNWHAESEPLVCPFKPRPTGGGGGDWTPLWVFFSR